MTSLIIPDVGIDCPLPDAALEYALRGLTVVPLAEGGKNPLVKWKTRQVSLSEEIHSWWEAWPNANVGILTGSRSGVSVIDIDTHKGGSLAALQALGQIPPTFTVRTGNGGLHLYFQHSEGITDSTRGALPHGVDVRGEGGLVAAPPSLHASGRRYEVVDASPVAPMPDWLYTLLTTAPERAMTRSEAPVSSGPASLWVDKAVAKVVEGEGRNEVGFWLACQLGDSGLNQVDATPHMESYQTRVQDAGDHPYTLSEAYATLRSAYSRERREPARAVEDSSQFGTNSGTTCTLPALTDESLTDVGNADRFAAQYGDRLKHVTGWGWVAYDGRRWVKGAEKQAQEWAKACLLDMLSEAQGMEDRRLQVDVIGHVKRSLSAYRIASMMMLAASDPRMSATAEDFDQDRHLLNVANGTIDLRDGSLREHRAADRITLLAQVEWNPEAEAPRFMRFLSEVFDGDDELIAYVQRLAGYTASGETVEQKYVTLYGSGCNGKGTLVRILSYVLGDYAETLSADTFTMPKYSGGEHTTPGLHKLPGRRFVDAQEPEGDALNTGLIKSLTGEDQISVNPKHKDAYTFQPVLKLWLATNKRLEIGDQTNAIWRRTIPIDFPVSFVGREDLTLDAQLQSEASGVLNWLVEGAKVWYAQGLGDLPAAVAETKREYRAEQDPASVFFDEVLVAAPESSRVLLKDAYRAYEAWQSENRDAEYVTERRFKRLAEAHDCHYRKSNGQTWLVGRALIGAADSAVTNRDESDENDLFSPKSLYGDLYEEFGENDPDFVTSSLPSSLPPAEEAEAVLRRRITRDRAEAQA